MLFFLRLWLIEIFLERMNVLFNKLAHFRSILFSSTKHESTACSLVQVLHQSVRKGKYLAKQGLCFLNRKNIFHLMEGVCKKKTNMNCLCCLSLCVQYSGVQFEWFRFCCFQRKFYFQQTSVCFSNILNGFFLRSICNICRYGIRIQQMTCEGTLLSISETRRG